jgi:hypothetical protein
MAESYFPVFSGRSQVLHLMLSRHPQPRGVVGQFAIGADFTLCGKVASRPAAGLFGVHEVSCRECKRRWEIATGQRQGYLSVRQMQHAEFQAKAAALKERLDQDRARRAAEKAQRTAERQARKAARRGKEAGDVPLDEDKAKAVSAMTSIWWSLESPIS